MKKNFLQDVIPASQKRSIRDIPLPSHQKQRAAASKEPVQAPVKSKPADAYPSQATVKETEYTFSKEEHSVFEPEKLQHASSSNLTDDDQEPEYSSAPAKEKRIPPYKKSQKSIMKKIVVGILIGIAIFLGFIFSRTEAMLTIHPKKTNQDINTIIALDSTSPQVTKTQITKTVTKTLPATSEQQVEKQASGRIRIINTHKDVPQELVKNTRFQTPSGLIYRIKDSIEVPGYTMSGSTIVPGTLEVEVYADSAGEEYNISNTKFTIPGFAGREQFDKITAETVSNIAGGYIGIQKVVTQEAKDQAEEELKVELENQIKQTQNESTEYVIVPSPDTLVYGELQDKAEGNSVVLTLSGSVDAYSLVKKDLFNFLGQSNIQGATSADQFTLNNDPLTYVIEDEAIKVAGNTIVTWVTDVEQLKKDFMGKKRSEIIASIDKYRSFEKADVNLSPFWKTRFPSDTAKIDVVIAE